MPGGTVMSPPSRPPTASTSAGRSAVRPAWTLVPAPRAAGRVRRCPFRGRRRRLVLAESPREVRDRRGIGGAAVRRGPNSAQPASSSRWTRRAPTTSAPTERVEGATPALDALASEGVVFEQAMSTAPLTLPAHSSIFTGKFPPEHGVRDNGGFFLDASAGDAGRACCSRQRLPDGRVRRGLRARPQVGDRPGLRHLLRRVRYRPEARRQVVRATSSAAANEVVDARAAVARRPRRAGRSSRGSTSTIPTRPTRRPEPFDSRFPGEPVQR